MKRWLLAACLATAAGAAPAALWGWVDGMGVAHFASQPSDARWMLVPGDADTSRASALRVPGKADGAGALLTWLDISPQVKAVLPWLREAALRHGVDAELLTAVIAVESRFNADGVSPRGAIGLMQITAETGDRYATVAERLAPAETRLLDPRTNTQTGARMLADLQRRYARVDVALAARNAGEGTVRRHGGAMPPINETRAHVHLVMELYRALLQRSQVQRATSMKLR